MPSSPAVRMMTRADSAPARWPSMRGRWRWRAQRPFPSMMMATCRGSDALASGLRWAVWALKACSRRLQVDYLRSKQSGDEARNGLFWSSIKMSRNRGRLSAGFEHRGEGLSRSLQSSATRCKVNHYPFAARNSRTQSGGGHEVAARRLHATLQFAARSLRALIPQRTGLRSTSTRCRLPRVVPGDLRPVRPCFW